MWNNWRTVFEWNSLCPVLLADALGLVVVMARAVQPVTEEEVNSLPDYYPSITSEPKPEDHGRLAGKVVAVDYGLGFVGHVLERRKYYESHPNKPALLIEE